MIYYKLVKVTIDVLGLAKVIINIIIRYYGFLNLIIIDKNFFLSQNFYHPYIISLILNKSY